MSKYGYIILFIISGLNVDAQKKVIDFEAIESWYSVSRKAAISNDGNYIVYGIDSNNGSKTLITKAVNSDWKREFANSQSDAAVFTDNNRFLLFQCGRDSLACQRLGQDDLLYRSSVYKWQLVGRNNLQRLAYITQDSAKSKMLVLVEPGSGQERRVEGVRNFETNKAGTTLVLSYERGGGVGIWDLESTSPINIATGKKIGKTLLDNRGKRLAYVIRGDNNVAQLWLYDVTSKKTSLLNNIIPEFTDSALISNIRGFSGNDSVLYVELQKPDEMPLSKGGETVKVCIWGTDDISEPVFNYCAELPKVPRRRNYAAMILLYSSQFIRLESDDTTVIQPDFKNKDWFLRSLGSNKRSITGSWNELVSGSNGRRWQLNKIPSLIEGYMKVSPSGKYLVYYDDNLGQHCSYDVYKQVARPITEEVNNNWTLPADHDSGRSAAPNYSGWLSGAEEKIYVGDGSDLWLLDVSGKQKPVNITSGIGKSMGLVFSMVDQDADSHCKNEQLWIHVFDKRTKSVGFILIPPDKQLKASQIHLQPYFYYGAAGMAARTDGYDFVPVKAANKDVYLVRKMTASQSPNFFTTTDFRNLTLQSSAWPEKIYDWPNAELLRWSMAGGKEVEGVLLKPDSFNPEKKYPVIINYYEKDADGLHFFRKPELMNSDINVPWFISRGYLVLIIDIHYKTGHPGESAFECVNSAADKLEELPYVDRERIGLQGHSLGGYETNAVVAKTGRFAAAVSAAGIIDLVGFYGDVTGFRSSMQMLVEYHQLRMGRSIWERKNNYLANSPILDVDKVTTPILIMHNIKDGNVPFTQGVAFYMALKRCKKKAWFLQYDSSSHILINEEDSKDYTGRVTDFFEHYLKNKPMPKWMASNKEAQFKRFLD